MAGKPGNVQSASGMELMAAALTREEVLVLPAVIDVVTAGRALGLGRTLTHELVRRGEFPVPVLRVGRVYRVPTAGVLKLLALYPPSDNAAENARQ
jgi:hypothetical protein